MKKGTMIFIPSYFDYVRVRNFLKKREVEDDIDFVKLSEYVSIREIKLIAPIYPFRMILPPSFFVNFPPKIFGILDTAMLTSLLCRYTNNKMTTKARQRFANGETDFMLFTERAHFYRR